MKIRNAEELRDHREWYRNKYRNNPEFRAKENARMSAYGKKNKDKINKKQSLRKFIREYCSHPGDKELKEILE
jgi:hypothetical protein